MLDFIDVTVDAMKVYLNVAIEFVYCVILKVTEYQYTLKLKSLNIHIDIFTTKTEDLTSQKNSQVGCSIVKILCPFLVRIENYLKQFVDVKIFQLILFSKKRKAR